MLSLFGVTVVVYFMKILGSYSNYVFIVIAIFCVRVRLAML